MMSPNGDGSIDRMGVWLMRDVLVFVLGVPGATPGERRWTSGEW